MQQKPLAIQNRSRAKLQGTTEKAFLGFPRLIALFIKEIKGILRQNYNFASLLIHQLAVRLPPE